MAQGYYQIEVDLYDRNKLAFITRFVRVFENIYHSEWAIAQQPSSDETVIFTRSQLEIMPCLFRWCHSPGWQNFEEFLGRTFTEKGSASPLRVWNLWQNNWHPNARKTLKHFLDRPNITEIILRALVRLQHLCTLSQGRTQTLSGTPPLEQNWQMYRMVKKPS